MLGKTGKLARALGRYWAQHPPRGLDLAWYGRDELEPTTERAEAVVALWGVTGGEAKALAANVALARRAQAIAAQMGAERVLHLSSAAVYGAQGGRLKEDAALTPTRPYGVSKVEMELAVAHAEGPHGILLRLANVAGSDSLFHNLAKGGEITLDRFESGGGPWRSYIAIPELAQVLEALIKASLADIPDVLNVAAPEPVAMEAIVRAAGRDFLWKAAGPEAIERVALDVSALMRFVPMAAEASQAEHLVGSWHKYGGWS